MRVGFSYFLLTLSFFTSCAFDAPLKQHQAEGGIFGGERSQFDPLVALYSVPGDGPTVTSARGTSRQDASGEPPRSWVTLQRVFSGVRLGPHHVLTHADRASAALPISLLSRDAAASSASDAALQPEVARGDEQLWVADDLERDEETPSIYIQNHADSQAISYAVAVLELGLEGRGPGGMAVAITRGEGAGEMAELSTTNLPSPEAGEPPSCGYYAEGFGQPTYSAKRARVCLSDAGEGRDIVFTSVPEESAGPVQGDEGGPFLNAKGRVEGIVTNPAQHANVRGVSNYRFHAAPVAPWYDVVSAIVEECTATGGYASCLCALHDKGMHVNATKLSPISEGDTQKGARYEADIVLTPGGTHTVTLEGVLDALDPMLFRKPHFDIEVLSEEVSDLEARASYVCDRQPREVKWTNCEASDDEGCTLTEQGRALEVSSSVRCGHPLRLDNSGTLILSFQMDADSSNSCKVARVSVTTSSPVAQ